VSHLAVLQGTDRKFSFWDQEEDEQHVVDRDCLRILLPQQLNQC
jgi:hypothetical protein